MYGILPDADLVFLRGKTISQIAIGQYDVQFGYGDGAISVWSRFAYYDSRTRIETVWSEGNPEAASPALRLVTATINGVKWSTNGTLELTFSNGDRLTIFDDDPQHEAYSISNGQNPLIVV